jgi:L-aspartate oxidase
MAEGWVRQLSDTSSAAGDQEHTSRGNGDQVDTTTGQPVDAQKERDRLQRTMIEGAGVVRSAVSLAGAAIAVAEVAATLGPAPRRREDGELANLVVAARALLAAAALRTETRGAHARSDFLATDEAWRHRLVHSGDMVAVLTGSAVAGPGSG